MRSFSQVDKCDVHVAYVRPILIAIFVALIFLACSGCTATRERSYFFKAGTLGSGKYGAEIKPGGTGVVAVYWTKIVYMVGHGGHHDRLYIGLSTPEVGKTYGLPSTEAVATYESESESFTATTEECLGTVFVRKYSGDALELDVELDVWHAGKERTRFTNHWRFVRKSGK